MLLLALIAGLSQPGVKPVDRVSITLVFGREDARNAWLSKLPAVMEGEFDEKAGRAVRNVHVPRGS